MSDYDSLIQSLEWGIDDQVTLLALADWHEERGDEFCTVLRSVIGYQPYCLRLGGKSGGDYAYQWMTKKCYELVKPSCNCTVCRDIIVIMTSDPNCTVYTRSSMPDVSRVCYDTRVNAFMGLAKAVQKLNKVPSV